MAGGAFSSRIISPLSNTRAGMRNRSGLSENIVWRCVVTGSSHLKKNWLNSSRLRSAVFAGSATLCLQAAFASQAFSQTSYQASSVQDGCVSTNVCKFTFPAPAGNLTITHASCSIVTTETSSYAGGVNYLKLFSSSTPSQQDFLVPEEFVYGSDFLSQMSQATLYSVPAGATPQINAHTVSTIAAPTAIDEPTCFISGTIN